MKMKESALTYQSQHVLPVRVVQMLVSQQHIHTREGVLIKSIEKCK